MLELGFYDGIGRVILDADHGNANVGGDDGECKWSASARHSTPTTDPT